MHETLRIASTWTTAAQGHCAWHRTLSKHEKLTPAALGIPLLASMYPTASDMVRASVQIPVILYTAEQIFVGQFMVWYFRRWLARDRAKRAQQELEAEGENAGAGSQPDVDGRRLRDRDQAQAASLELTGGGSRLPADESKVDAIYAPAGADGSGAARGEKV